jgi:hypothetical protein
MTPKEAEKHLLERHKRVELRKGGAPSLKFTRLEKLAVQCLAAHAHTQATIANRAHMSIKQLSKAFEGDPELREAYDQGIAEERLRIDTALLKTATDGKNPRQVQAAMSLLKSRHGVTEGGGKGVSVQVNNVLALPSPQDSRKYLSTVKRVAARAPVTVEHAPQEQDRAPIKRVDPVAAVRAAQGERE